MLTVTPSLGHKRHNTLGTDSNQEFHGVMMLVVRPSLCSCFQVCWPFTENFKAIYDDHTSPEAFSEGNWHCLQ